jgi:hypothetical protein
VIGKIIKWTEREFSLGQIRENTKVLIERIKKKAMEFLNGMCLSLILGMMVVFIKATGRMENNMVRVNFIRRKRIPGRRVSGMMVKELNGKIQLTNNFFNINRLYLFILNTN